MGATPNIQQMTNRWWIILQCKSPSAWFVMQSLSRVISHGNFRSGIVAILLVTTCGGNLDRDYYHRPRIQATFVIISTKFRYFYPKLTIRLNLESEMLRRNLCNFGLVSTSDRAENLQCSFFWVSPISVKI